MTQVFKQDGYGERDPANRTGSRSPRKTSHRMRVIPAAAQGRRQPRTTDSENRALLVDDHVAQVTDAINVDSGLIPPLQGT